MRCYAAALVVIAASGCGKVRPCRVGTLFIAVDYGAASSAAALVVTISTKTSGVSTAPIANVLERGTPAASDLVEIDFPHGYPEGGMFSVDLAAKTGDAVIATAHASLAAMHGCSSLSLALIASSADLSLIASSADLSLTASSADLPLADLPLADLPLADARSIADAPGDLALSEAGPEDAAAALDQRVAMPDVSVPRDLFGIHWVQENADPMYDLRGVWGTGQGMVLAVGGVPPPGRQTVQVMKTTGGAWSTTEILPDRPPQLRAVGGNANIIEAVGGANTIFAIDSVGRAGGQSLIAMAGGFDLTGYFATANYALAVGGMPGGMGGEILVSHDGTHWTPDTPALSNALSAVFGSDGSPGLYLAVGLAGTIERTSMPGASTTWIPATNPDPAKHSLRGVHGSSALDVYAVGDNGTVLRCADGAGLSWQVVSPSGANETFNAVWSGAPGEAFVVGNHGMIYHTANGGVSWDPPSNVVQTDLFGVWGNNPGDVYAVGAGGVILHYR